jgi:hypothetical protein
MKIVSNNPVFFPGRLISLWDMMRFEAREFVLLFEELDAWILLVHDKPGRETTDPERQKFRDLARRLCNECQRYNLKGAARRADILYRRLTEDLNKNLPAPAPPRAFSALDEDLREIREEIADELRTLHLVLMNRQNADFYERDNLFGDEIAKALPETTKAEIKAAGNCLAFELNTAAVFHLMRASELGLRTLALKLNAWKRSLACG